MTLPDVLRAAGGLLIVGAYTLLQLERLDPRSLVYSWTNALGAGLILVSLAFDFNLGAALVESFWLLVSLFGVASSLRRRRLGATPAESPEAGELDLSEP